MVRLLGEGVVYRLEQPGRERSVHRVMSAIRDVVCAEPPCDVWLPYDVSLAVQLRGRNYALGKLALPPRPGILWTAIGGRPRRVAAGIIMATTLVAGIFLFAAGAGEDPDAWLSLQPVFNGMGAALILGGVLAGGIMLAIPRRGVARWGALGAGRGWH